MLKGLGKALSKGRKITLFEDMNKKGDENEGLLSENNIREEI